jgi:serine/threonine-protein kinase
MWVNRDGAATPLAVPQRPYEHPRLSPDGKRVVFSTPDEKVFVLDIARNQFHELSPDGRNEFPIWTPDGKRVAFLSNRNGSRNIWWMPADGSGPAEQLTYSKNVNEPSGWSSDGRLLLVTDQAPQTNRNILLLRVDRAANRERTTETILATAVDESSARFSPDGKWIVYYSNETGKSEIYVKAFPLTAERWKISIDGGSEPVWSQAGNEIFYRNGDKMMSVEVKTAAEFTASAPRLLFAGNYRHGVTFRPDYDVASDGKRFLMVRGSEQPPTAAQITLVPNWNKKAKSP